MKFWVRARPIMLGCLCWLIRHSLRR
eukprot:COSAG02_NODE_58917_length_276_cov_0.536723_2_plen_25_part_01